MELSIEEKLRQKFNVQRDLYLNKQITREQFQDAVGDLVEKDEQGTWWSIDSEFGEMQYFNGTDWVFIHKKEDNHPSSPVVTRQEKQSDEREIRTNLLMIGFPILMGVIWFAYASLPASSEGLDCLTPMIITGVPLSFIIFRDPLDRLLLPLQNLKRGFPAPMLFAVAVGGPLVMGLVCSSTTTAGYSVMRLVSLAGMLFSYALLRNPEVTK